MVTSRIQAVSLRTRRDPSFIRVTLACVARARLIDARAVGTRSVLRLELRGELLRRLRPEQAVCDDARGLPLLRELATRHLPVELAEQTESEARIVVAERAV